MLLEALTKEPKLFNLPSLDCGTEERKESAGKVIAKTFYSTLQREVIKGNPFLEWAEQLRLQSHYPQMMNLERYPPELASMIYVARRSQPVQAILHTEAPLVFDAGCGYGSESFLFAGLGAKVLAVDVSTEQIRIARKRQHYYEEYFEKPLDITFTVADLEEYRLEVDNLSLTWLASVLAAVRNQNKFLEMTYETTRPEGQIMITDMNLFNPLFLIKEWHRRQQAKKHSPEFAGYSNLWAMVNRQGRIGARYFTGNNGKPFDDVQFFSVATLSKLLSDVGFTASSVVFSGFVPPQLWQLGLDFLENFFSRLPILRRLGYFYLVTGIKQ